MDELDDIREADVIRTGIETGDAAMMLLQKGGTRVSMRRQKVTRYNDLRRTEEK